MTKILLSDLKPGMKIAKDIVLYDGRILLLKGYILKNRCIQKLKLYKIPYIFVDESIEIPEAELREERIYSEAFNTIKLANVKYH